MFKKYINKLKNKAYDSNTRFMINYMAEQDSIMTKQKKHIKKNKLKKALKTAKNNMYNNSIHILNELKINHGIETLKMSDDEGIEIYKIDDCITYIENGYKKVKYSLDVIVLYRYVNHLIIYYEQILMHYELISQKEYYVINDIQIPLKIEYDEIANIKNDILRSEDIIQYDTGYLNGIYKNIIDINKSIQI